MTLSRCSLVLSLALATGLTLSAAAQMGPMPTPVPQDVPATAPAPAPRDVPTTAPAPPPPPAAPKLPDPHVLKVPDPAQVVKDFFVAAAGSKDYSAAVKDHIAKAVADAKDPAQQTDVIALCLAKAYPDFSKALLDLADEQLVAAVGALQKQAKSADPYLAAYAGYFLARAYVAQGAFEQAKPLLADLTGKSLDKTTVSGEALFLRGVCERKLLDRTAALQTFVDFLSNYKDAPERLVIGAATQVGELMAIAAKPMEDVQDRMDFSHNRLAREKSDKDITQAEQDRIIALLDKLIKEAEDKEKKGGGGGGGSGSGDGQGSPGGTTGGKRPSGGAAKSTAPEGQARYGDLKDVIRSNPGEDWGKEKERERKEVNDAINTKFPDRYRALLEQYYKGLAEGDKDR